MPNRILKESICGSETIDRLTAFEETFFYRLIVNCDDYGAMDARPSILKAKLFPLKDVRVDAVAQALSALVRAGTAEVYEVDGKPYLQVLAWGKHQITRAAKRKYPEKPAAGVLQSTESVYLQLKTSEIKCKQMISDAPVIRNTHSYSNSESYSETRTKPGREEKPSRTLGKRVRRDSSGMFDAFWASYPRKVAKEAARKAWDKIGPDEELVGRMVAAVKAQAATEQWRRDGGRFIPHPATWLGARRWEDEIDAGGSGDPQGSVEGRAGGGSHGDGRRVSQYSQYDTPKL